MGEDTEKGKGLAQQTDKLIVITHPTNGSVRTITEQEWKDNEAGFLAEGFAPPAGMEGGSK